jgi:putrescine transport system permease protein
MHGRSWFRNMSLIVGFSFLYIPIVSLIVYSFNKSKLVTVWGGFSTMWYGELLRNEQILNAAWLSLRVAAISATLAVALGTLAGMVLARFGPFKGRMMFSGLTTAPLVMPEVITGLSLLLLFVTMEQLIGWPAGRGMTTIIISHVTFTMAFVTVIVQSRLAQMDESLEEAALDLGARPWKVFFLITLPMVIFSKVRLGVSPDINALATILVGVVAFGVLIAGITMTRQQKLRDRDAQMALAANQQMIESMKKG